MIMQEKHKTSLYVATLSEFSKIPTRREIRQGLINMLTNKKDELHINIDERERIHFGNIKIDFRVRDLPSDRRILIAFKPTGDGNEISSWKKVELTNAALETLKFCEVLGDSFNLNIRNSLLNFNRIYLSEEIFADFKIADEFNGKTHNYNDFLKDRYSIMKNVVNKLPPYFKDKTIWIFCEPSTKGEAGILIRFLRNNIRCKILGPTEDVGLIEEHSQSIIREHLENKYLVIIVGSDIAKDFYKKEKIWLSQHNIANQFIKKQNIEKLKKYPGVKYNFLLEIASKLGIKVFKLLPPSQIDNIAFLCLSDIRMTPEKLFGILILYSSETSRREEEKLYIYKDVPFKVLKHRMYFDEKATIKQLVEKILTLGIPSNFLIDILLTKEWKREDLDTLLNLLRENGLNIECVYYISSMASRFISEHLFLDTKEGYPFISLGKTGFIFPTKEVRIYPTLFPIYIHLYYPDRNLTQEDFQKILWLTKRRLYRIQELEVTKLPEPLNIFSGIRKLWMPKIEATLEIPIRLLI